MPNCRAPHNCWNNSHSYNSDVVGKCMINQKKLILYKFGRLYWPYCDSVCDLYITDLDLVYIRLQGRLTPKSYVLMKLN